MLAGLTAGIMGIIYASYLGSVSTNVQGGQNVLLAVAAAVIGGVSLFGGRSKMLGAVLGGVIVAVIYNGLGLLAWAPPRSTCGPRPSCSPPSSSTPPPGVAGQAHHHDPERPSNSFFFFCRVLRSVTCLAGR